jgi:hypothetical protein
VAHARIAAPVAAAGVAAVAVGALIAGCGFAHSWLGFAGRAGSPVRGIHARPWPPGGSPAIARAFGRRMLAGLVLPPGARRIGFRRVPDRADLTGSDNLVDVRSFFVVPMPMPALAVFLKDHPPGRALTSGTGTSNSQTGVTEDHIEFQWRSTPVGVTGDSQLVVSLAPGRRGSTVARVDAEVVWYPPRTAAEYVRADAIRSARITANFYNPTRHVAKVITSGRAIARLATLLNGMRASDNSTTMCPMFGADYRVTFIGRGGQPRIAVDAVGCLRDGVHVNGLTQPQLWDPKNRLVSALNRLLGVSTQHG